MAGKLYLCATPIGNLEDMTFRAIRILQEVDLIAAEDTRNSIKLLNHFEIHTPMTSYHEYNKYDKGRELVQKLLAGTNIALITDAGTPGISDPGEELVKMAYEAGIEVTSLPGACACVTALTLSGLSTRRFVFEAFLPPDKKEHKLALERLKNETRTMIVYEAPHHLLKTLREQDRETRVLILSARSRISDKVEGLDCGANDYLVKPFHLEELEARVRSLTRRSFVQHDAVLRCGELSFDTVKRTAQVRGEVVALTRKENGILEYLLLNQGRPVSQEELMEHVWDGSVNIRVHISSLRKKLKAALGYDPILNRIGEGYLMGGREP